MGRMVAKVLELYYNTIPVCKPAAIQWPSLTVSLIFVDGKAPRSWGVRGCLNLCKERVILQAPAFIH